MPLSFRMHPLPRCVMDFRWSRSLDAYETWPLKNSLMSSHPIAPGPGTAVLRAEARQSNPVTWGVRLPASPVRRRHCPRDAPTVLPDGHSRWGVGHGPLPAAGAGLDARFAKEVLPPGDVRCEPVSRWTTGSSRERRPPISRCGTASTRASTAGATTHWSRSSTTDCAGRPARSLSEMRSRRAR